MKFYVVSSKDGFADAVYDRQKIIEHRCEKCGGIYRTDRTGPYKVHFLGKKTADFYNAPGCFIGNIKFRDMLVHYNLTGYEISDIDCTGWYDRRNHLIDMDSTELKEISVVGRCGSMRYRDGSEIEKCGMCGRVQYETEWEVRGLSVPEESWDGTDLFHFENRGSIMIVTQRFKDACETEKIKGIAFQEVEKFTFVPWVKVDEDEK